MLEKEIITLINSQITKEFFSAYLYLDFSNYYEVHGFAGFASWFKIQAKEELDHGLMLSKYLHDNGGSIKLEKIESPNIDIKELIDPLIASLKHEQYVTESINKIYARALELKDFRTTEFLSWFIKEQAEEEKSAQMLISKMMLFGNEGKNLYLLDQELAQRKSERKS